MTWILSLLAVLGLVAARNAHLRQSTRLQRIPVRVRTRPTRR